MATSKVRVSTTALAKDRKAVSSTNAHTTLTKRTAITTKPRSATGSNIDKASSTPSEKHVPNYPKPKRTSRIEPPVLKSQSLSAKKTGVREGTVSSKPVVDRRRSFDSPPSAARLHKAYVSPVPREKNVTVKSRSLLSSKPIVEKTSKTARDGKTQALSRRNKSNVKSSSPTLTKKTRPAGSEVPKSIEHVTQIWDSDAKSELDHQETLSEKSEQVEVDHNEVEIPTDQALLSDYSSDTVNEHEQHHNVVDSDYCKNGGGKFERDIPIVSEELKKSIFIMDEDQEDHDHEPEAHAAEPESENAGGVESSDENSEEENYSVNACIDIEVGVIEEEGEENKVVQMIETVVKKLDDTERTESESDIGITQKEGRDNVEGGAEKSETTAAKRQGGSEVKKESPGYNEVIEETKNKLMGKRANRVRALVGAFQAVINYESESASK